jgi:predicted metalloprotease with PDZ domain
MLKPLGLLLTSALALATAATMARAAGGPTAAAERALILTLAPHANGNAVDYIDATLVIEGLTVAKGEPVLRMPLVVASIPTQRYDGNALTASDDAGALALVQRDAAPTPFGTDRDWLASRPPKGTVTARFRVVPRLVDANTRPGPLFDLRAEAGGVMGAGMTFVPIPIDQGRYRISIRWNLSGVPTSFRAVSCRADDDATFNDAAKSLTECYYAVGPLRVYPSGSAQERKFGIYWLTKPPFDVTLVAAQIQKLFAYMSVFFHDTGDSYRVFVRMNPYDGGGGTALKRSFMFGWNAHTPPTVEGLEGLLSHEMTHNWPRLDGEHAETSWYSEGTAEYYSILLSWRAGVIDSAQFLKRINTRAAGYYENPLQTLTNQQAEERYWKEANASYVPYGRGFMYLADTDAEIRAQSSGKRNLDDIVVALVDRARRGESHGIADWLDLVSREIGPKAETEYRQMTAGTQLVPRPNGFGPCFKPESYVAKLNDLGFDEASLLGPKKIIRGLVPGSNAASAGVREGDVVARRSPPDYDDRNHEMTLTIERDGKETNIQFRPEGKSVPAYRWARVPGVPESDCRY